MQEKSHAMTLIELLFSLGMLFFIAMVAVSIETFVRAHTYEADLKAQLQNEILIVLEHISKEAGEAIGNEFLYGNNSTVRAGPEGNEIVLRAYIDADEDGRRDVPTAGGPDYWVAYRWYNNNAAAADRFQVRYCSRCAGAISDCPWSTCPAANRTIISGMSAVSARRRIANLDLIVNKDASDRLVENFIFANITACRDPENIDLTINPSGTTDNPCVNMQSRILLPSVSTN